MDAVGQSYNIVVAGANNDPCVQRYFSVESDKVASIKRQHRSTSRCREGFGYASAASLMA